MKTTKLFLSIALVALATTLIGSTPNSNSEFASCTIETVYEKAIDMENWMSAPFEVSIKENDLVMEDWMSVPFESSLAENVLVLENWMSSPFKAGVEDEVLSLESWMATPFEIKADAGDEKLMCSVCI